MNFIPVAIGGACGALGRFYVSSLIYKIFGKSFPIGILCVNVLGSFLMGMCIVLFLEVLPIQLFWRQLILVGFLGAFTTFSTFSLDTIELMQQGFYFKALSYVLLSVILSLLGTFAGMLIIKWCST